MLIVERVQASSGPRLADAGGRVFLNTGSRPPSLRGSTTLSRAVPPVAIALALLLGAASAHAASFAERLHEKGYELILEKDGVSVYKHRNCERIRFVAEGRFEASPERVRAALLDYERHVGLVDRLSDSRILEKKDAELLVYQRLALPLISDRDMTLRVTWGGDARKAWISYEAVKGGPSPVDGVVRLRHYRGKWRLKALEGGHATRARLFVDMDMGGSLPPALASSNAGKDVPALFRAIARLLERTARGSDNHVPGVAPEERAAAELPR